MTRARDIQEPVIVCFGRQNIERYTVQEYKNNLVRVFKNRGADFITLDSNMNGQRFAAASVAWAIDEGILYNDQNDEHDDQYVVSSFRLTKKGKKEIMG